MYTLEVITYVLKRYMPCWELKTLFECVGKFIQCCFPFNDGEKSMDYGCMILKCIND